MCACLLFQRINIGFKQYSVLRYFASRGCIANLSPTCLMVNASDIFILTQQDSQQFFLLSSGAFVDFVSTVYFMLIHKNISFLPSIKGSSSTTSNGYAVANFVNMHLSSQFLVFSTIHFTSTWLVGLFGGCWAIYFFILVVGEILSIIFISFWTQQSFTSRLEFGGSNDFLHIHWLTHWTVLFHFIHMLTAIGALER